MENQNFYEGRILVNMAASVMRQEIMKKCRNGGKHAFMSATAIF